MLQKRRHSTSNWPPNDVLSPRRLTDDGQQTARHAWLRKLSRPAITRTSHLQSMSDTGRIRSMGQVSLLRVKSAAATWVLTSQWAIEIARGPIIPLRKVFLAATRQYWFPARGRILSLGVDSCDVEMASIPCGEQRIG